MLFYITTIHFLINIVYLCMLACFLFIILSHFLPKYVDNVHIFVHK